jgi:hypothetical protein
MAAMSRHSFNIEPYGSMGFAESGTKHKKIKSINLYFVLYGNKTKGLYNNFFSNLSLWASNFLD